MYFFIIIGVDRVKGEDRGGVRVLGEGSDGGGVGRVVFWGSDRGWLGGSE